MFIKAYVLNEEDNEFIQISLDDKEICVIFQPVVFCNATIFQKEYIEKNNFSVNRFKIDKITMHSVLLKNGIECYVCEDELGYVADGVYCRKGG